LILEYIFGNLSYKRGKYYEALFSYSGHFWFA
jgi:hypothetical protein